MADQLDQEEKAIVLAHLAESAERYDEMQENMKHRVLLGGALSATERDLLSAAYKAALAGPRLAFQVATSVEQQEKDEGRLVQAALAADYRRKVEHELQTICNEVIGLVTDNLLPRAETGEPKAFYMKLQGDYWRYLTECARGDDHAKATDEARAAYVAATEEASSHLLKTHPVRLSLALNLAVFQHEVLDDTEAAVATASAALKGASECLECMPEEAFQQIALTMQLIQDNLSLWTS